MQTFSISVLGRDCPGIVAGVCQTLSSCRCNIVQLTQTTLRGEFAAIYIVTVDGTTAEKLHVTLEKAFAAADIDLSVLVRNADGESWTSEHPAQPYVVTCDGPDGPGLIATMSKVFARHGINIENIQAVLGHGGENHALFLFEVSVPDDADVGRLRREVQSAGRDCGLTVSVQHRDIFEAMHRITEF